MKTVVETDSNDLDGLERVDAYLDERQQNIHFFDCHMIGLSNVVKSCSDDDHYRQKQQGNIVKSRP